MRFLSRFKLPSTWLAVLSPSNSLGPEAFVLSGVIIIQLAWSVLEGCAGTLSFQAHRSLDRDLSDAVFEELRGCTGQWSLC